MKHLTLLEHVKSFVNAVEEVAQRKGISFLSQDEFIKTAEVLLQKEENRIIKKLYKLYCKRFLWDKKTIKAFSFDVFVKRSFFTALMVASEKVKLPEVVKAEIFDFLSTAERWLT